jgi:hypothetical protein
MCESVSIESHSVSYPNSKASEGVMSSRIDIEE